jgi:hypothetical protein
MEVAGNVQSNAIWGMLYKGKLTGNMIVKYDAKNDAWIEDKSQPAGAQSITVDSKGMPVITAIIPHRFYHK